MVRRICPRRQKELEQITQDLIDAALNFFDEEIEKME